MWAVKDTGKFTVAGTDNKPNVEEKIVIMCYGKEGVQVMRDMVEDAVEYALHKEQGLLGVY